MPILPEKVQVLINLPNPNLPHVSQARAKKSNPTVGSGQSEEKLPDFLYMTRT